MKQLLLLLCFLAYSSQEIAQSLLPGGFAAKPPLQAITFTENKGQVSDQFQQPRPDVLYSGTSGGMTWHLRNNGISYQLTRIDSWRETNDPRSGKVSREPDQCNIYRLDASWLNCNTHAAMTEDEALPGYSNYYSGSHPGGILDVKAYRGVWYKNIYSSIDLHYYEKNGTLKYDYLVAAGADYKQIRLEIKGAESIRLDSHGGLVMKTPLGTITEQAPLVLQNGKELPAKWILENTVLSFDIQGLDPQQAFIIDPAVRSWGTFYGGESDDRGYACSTDRAGNVIMSGQTGSNSGTSIATTGSHQAYLGMTVGAFLVKFNSSGVRLWSTYYGTLSRGYCCTTDASGNIFMGGSTSEQSGNGGIATPGSHQPTTMGFDAFLAKFNSAGVRQWGTYYGGASGDNGMSCCTDNAGNVYLAGYGTSTTGIATVGSYQAGALGGSLGSAFLVKFNASGARQWGTYYGGTGGAGGNFCATDANNNVFLAGSACPAAGTEVASAGAHQAACAGVCDAFLAKFDANGVRKWGTYYGGAGNDAGYACATDKFGNCYLSGNTESVSVSGIASSGCHQATHGGASSDGYLAKFDSSGVRQWGTYYGGYGNDQAPACATDPRGYVYIAGTTDTNFGTAIATLGSHQPYYSLGFLSAFLVEFDPSGVRQWGTYYGFSDEGVGTSCAADFAGNLYLAGMTRDDFPGIVSTPGSHQPTFGGPFYDAYLVQFYDCANANMNVVSSPSFVCLGQSATLTAYGATTLTWTSPATNSSSVVVTPTVASSYIVSGTNSNGCAVTGSVSHNVGPSPTVAILGQNIICSGAAVTLSATGATSYSWSQGSSGNTIALTPAMTSTYGLTGTDPNGCSGSATLYLQVTYCAGTDEKTGNDRTYALYPNPHHGAFTIELAEPAQVIIYNTLGKVVMQQTLDAGKNTLNLAGQANGMYMAQLNGKGIQATIKLIKE